jgi:hypothetical protein
VDRHCGLELLPGGGEEALGHGQVPVSAHGLPEGAVDKETVGAGARFPDRVPSSPQKADGAPEIGQSVIVAAEHRQQVPAAHEDPPRQDAGTAGDSLVERCEARIGPAGKAEGETERGLDIEGTLRRFRGAGESQRRAELGQRVNCLTRVAQDDPPDLPTDRRVTWARLSSQEPARSGKGVSGAVQRQRKQAFRALMAGRVSLADVNRRAGRSRGSDIAIRVTHGVSLGIYHHRAVRRQDAIV